jgi:predicted metal-dependent phosphoesterase TrpH
MNFVDLHVHSNASDGTLSPKCVVELAVKSNLNAIALTDHDTVDGVNEAIQAAKEAAINGHPIRVIPGTELSVAYKNKDIHILGLFVDPNNQTFKDELLKACLKRDERNEKMAQNLIHAGIDISISKMRKIEGNAVLTRAHFAKFLTEHGYTKSIKDAFDKYLNDESPYYVKREYLTPEMGINLIHEAGGLAILAHPLLYKYTLTEVEELVQHLCQFNLDGIEVIHSSNTGFDEGHLRRIGNKFGLSFSGGSDFHGENKPNIKLGIGFGNLKIPHSMLEILESNLKKEI